MSTTRKYVLRRDSGSKNALFLPSRSCFALPAMRKTGQILHTNVHSVQIFGLFCHIFCFDSLFCKHAKFSKVNAFWKLGVDFFQPSAVIFRQNRYKYQYFSFLAKPLKTRLFPAKNFLAQNYQNLEGVDCSFWEIIWKKINEYLGIPFNRKWIQLGGGLICLFVLWYYIVLYCFGSTV